MMSQQQISKERQRLWSTLPVAAAINFAALSVVFALIAWFREAVEIFTLPQIFHLFVLAIIYSNCMEISLAFMLSSQLPRLAAAPSVTGAFHFVARMLAAAAAGYVVAAVIVAIVEDRSGANLDISPVTKIITSVWSLAFSLMVWICVFGYESMTRTLEAAALQLSLQELQQERSRKLALEAQLSSLQSRTNPHFLFNALNSIAALIPEDPARAEHMVGRLAALLRFSLDSGQKRTVPLSQELRIVSDYLEIEKTRFQARIRYTLEIEPELDSIEVPPMSLQTLVENSVKYAVTPRREGGTIRIIAARIDSNSEQVRLQVWDDGPGFSLDTLPAGHGLDLLRARLHVLYGSRATLEAATQVAMSEAQPQMGSVAQQSARWMVVTICLPRHPAAAPNANGTRDSTFLNGTASPLSSRSPEELTAL